MPDQAVLPETKPLEEPVEPRVELSPDVTPTSPAEPETESDTSETASNQQSERVGMPPAAASSRRKRRFSVQGTLEQMRADEEKANQESERVGPTRAFTDNELREAWDLALDFLEKNNHINLHSTLREEGFERRENVLHTTVHSHAQRKELEEIATTFTEMIRAKVQHYGLTLSIEVSEIDEEKYDSFAVDPSEKFALMAAKNPALATLKTALDLRF